MPDYMPDYQKMYYIMCAAASKALDALPDDGRPGRSCKKP